MNCPKCGKDDIAFSASDSYMNKTASFYCPSCENRWSVNAVEEKRMYVVRSNQSDPSRPPWYVEPDGDDSGDDRTWFRGKRQADAYALVINTVSESGEIDAGAFGPRSLCSLSVRRVTPSPAWSLCVLDDSGAIILESFNTYHSPVAAMAKGKAIADALKIPTKEMNE